MVEPPGIFLGRGNHPMCGRWKRRIQPEDITINVGSRSKRPACPIAGHEWGNIISYHEASWIATWKDALTQSHKYVIFSFNSPLRSRLDIVKFERAQELKKNISNIREIYTSELGSADRAVAQRATAVWFIDHLGLRVGNEKDDSDTVGCCLFRIEHVKLLDKQDGEDYKIELDFIGKDSLRYHNIVSVEQIIYLNLKEFQKEKQRGDILFDKIDSTMIVTYLKSLMDGLTSKIFRIYNLSERFQNELNKSNFEKEANSSAEEKIMFFNKSSYEVASKSNLVQNVTTFSQNQDRVSPKLDVAMSKLMDLKKQKKQIGEMIEEQGNIIKNLEGINELKKDVHNVKLSTQKVNYIDPRISIAWCNRVGLDLNKVFSKLLQEKYSWAIEYVKQNPDFKY
eukprot:TRINITY_DN3424_c0_g1_i5.p1 TRINITY_DN3424_c0_g1~~TRINITY_DN3424_c0_g1_i5.p1  ORF type:complete len:396 (-),score=63.46 TRINITY_DN3424_c0_g1_i5:1084-2271(-)